MNGRKTEGAKKGDEKMRSKWQKREAKAKPRNVDVSGRNRLSKSKEKGLGETQRHAKKSNTAQRAEQTGNRSVGRSRHLGTLTTSTVSSKGPCSISHLRTLKSRDLLVTLGKNRSY